MTAEQKTNFRQAVQLHPFYQSLNLAGRNTNIAYQPRTEVSYLILELPCSCGSSTNYVFSVPNQHLNSDPSVMVQFITKK